jgi:hypothetical protein
MPAVQRFWRRPLAFSADDSAWSDSAGGLGTSRLPWRQVGAELAGADADLPVVACQVDRLQGVLASNGGSPTGRADHAGAARLHGHGGGVRTAHRLAVRQAPVTFGSAGRARNDSTAPLRVCTRSLRGTRHVTRSACPCLVARLSRRVGGVSRSLLVSFLVVGAGSWVSRVPGRGAWRGRR